MCRKVFSTERAFKLITRPQNLLRVELQRENRTPKKEIDLKLLLLGIPTAMAASCLQRTLRNVSSIKEQMKELDYLSHLRRRRSFFCSPLTPRSKNALRRHFIEYRV